jgi:penicillin-binding protein 2
MADSAGFGRRTGIELGGETDGLLPEHRRGWVAGDTCNISIGQGALAVTPLQMAVFAAALGNGGYVYRPRLLSGRWDLVGEGMARPGDLVKKLPWSESSLQVVRRGMREVVQSEFGSGKRARLPGVEMGGKTGTAEYGSKDAPRCHAWMLVFAPFEKPRYAVAIVIENGVSGGVTAAPRVRRLLEGVFALEGQVASESGVKREGPG